MTGQCRPGQTCVGQPTLDSARVIIGDQGGKMPGADKETDLGERIEAFLAELKRGGRGSGETARSTAALLRRITAQARWSSAGP
ncbi:hypothetical protein AOLI_G00040690 [Acnodon oligacanthus]